MIIAQGFLLMSLEFRTMQYIREKESLSCETAPT